MEISDYKQEWELFLTTQMRCTFNSACWDLALLTDDTPEGIAYNLLNKLFNKFAKKQSYGHFFLWNNAFNWCMRFAYEELKEHAIAIIERSRKEEAGA